MENLHQNTSGAFEMKKVFVLFTLFFVMVVSGFTQTPDPFSQITDVQFMNFCRDQTPSGMESVFRWIYSTAPRLSAYTPYVMAVVWELNPQANVRLQSTDRLKYVRSGLTQVPWTKKWFTQDYYKDYDHNNVWYQILALITYLEYFYENGPFPGQLNKAVAMYLTDQATVESNSLTSGEIESIERIRRRVGMCSGYLSMMLNYDIPRDQILEY
jgi:hypothetical protein